MMKSRTRTVFGMALAAIAVCGTLMTGGSPATAVPPYDDFYNLPTNTLSPQYLENGCRYRVMYGGFGQQPYAMMRIYDVAGCTSSSTSISLQYDDGSGAKMTTKYFSSGYTTGTDSCGSYRQVQVNGPSPAYAVYALAVVPDDPNDPGFLENWKLYSNDGDVTQPVHQSC